MSLGEMYFEASKSITEPEKLTGKSVTSNVVIGLMPLFPAKIFFQASSILLPTGEAMPNPVTTTRRLLKTCSLNDKTNTSETDN